MSPRSGSDQPGAARRPTASQRLLVCLSAALLLSACAGMGMNAEQARDASTNNALLGANYLQRGELDLARGKLEKALKQDPSNAYAHVTYAQLQFRIDETDRAETHFKKAIRLEPDDAGHRNSYGIFLCQQGELDAAEAEFKAAAANPYYDTPEFALDNAGLCMLDHGRLDQAETYLRESLRTNPQFANAYLHMADLLRQRQRLTLADAYYQRYQAYGQDTAASLLLGLEIKRELGDVQSAQRYAGRLLNEFPASREAGEYLARPLQ